MVYNSMTTIWKCFWWVVTGGNLVVTGSDVAIDLEMMTGVVGGLVVILVVGDWVFGGSVVVVGRVDNPRSRASMNIWALSFIVDWPNINLAMWNLVLMYSVCVKELTIMHECKLNTHLLSS